MEDAKIQTIRSWLGTGSINLFGRPFSGKDTQADILSKILDAPIIGGGDIIRNSQDETVKEIVGKGALAPTQAYLDMVLPYFSQQEWAGGPIILSSVGKWSGEETSIIKALEKSHHQLKAVVYFDFSEDQVLQRWQAAQSIGDRGSRADDDRTALDVRFDEFRNKTLPVVEFFRREGLLIEIDADQTHAKVTEDILTALFNRASA
jgi:adenylate kinase